jgi:hypothetical protein
MGYARVSMPDQDFSLQRDALQQAGCREEHVFLDIASGARTARPVRAVCTINASVTKKPIRFLPAVCSLRARGFSVMNRIISGHINLRKTTRARAAPRRQSGKHGNLWFDRIHGESAPHNMAPNA